MNDLKPILIFGALALAALPSVAEQMAEPTPKIIPIIKTNPPPPDSQIKEEKKPLPKLPDMSPPRSKYRQQRAIEDDYRKESEEGAKSPNGFNPTADAGEYLQTAKECGEAMQKRHSPAAYGGATMCGRAVSAMMGCMKRGDPAKCPVLTPGDKKTAICGHGKGFVDCKGGGPMAACGYEKVKDVRDPRCKMAGAVLAYNSSPTSRGKQYGHVEFVCGDNKYCSVYSAPHDRPWPRSPADGCWFPKGGGEKQKVNKS